LEVSTPSFQTSAKSPQSRGRRWLWPTAFVLGPILAVLAIWQSPVYSFHPTCTYTVNARVSAEVRVGDETLSSSVVYQNSRTRRWIAEINSAGCKQWYGNALTYRLADDRVLILPARICHKVADVLAKSGNINILDVCREKQAHQDTAYIVDSADRPQTWYTAKNGVDFHINSMTATSTRSPAADDIASVAPGLLKSQFKRNGRPWYGLDKLIPFERRYAPMRDQPNPSFEFEVNNERFEVE
jgi:hypothetical protein